jgi:BMFP domain-containing protein YqiC
MSKLDPEALSDLIIETIDFALGPLKERVAAVEGKFAMLADARDRVLQVEAKVAVADAKDSRIAELEQRISELEALLASKTDTRPPTQWTQ